MGAGGERAGLVFGVRGGVEAEDAAVDRSAGVGEGDIAGGSSLSGGAGDLRVEEKEAAVGIAGAVGDRRGGTVGGVVEQTAQGAGAGLGADGEGDGI